MKRANFRMGALLLALFWSGETMAAVCTSLSAGDWNVVARWNCGHIPVAADTVVIAHNAVRMLGAYTVAGITINAGAVLNGNNRNLTVNGAATINGTYNTNGGDLTTTGGGALTVNAGGTFNFNGGNAAINGNVVINGTLSSGGDKLQMTGANTTLSGTGNVVNTTIEIDATGVSVPVGANLKFDANSEIDVAANVSPASLTVNGTIDGTAQAAGDRIIRVSTGGSLTVGSTGVINAPNSRLDVRTGATATNNGTITIGELRGRTGAPTPVFTQGVNSTLNINFEVCITTRPCTFNASAAGNTVNYTGAAQTVYLPSSSTYANLTLSGSGAKTVPTGLTVAGNFTMSGTATVAAPAALAVGGNFIIGAGNTFTAGAGTVTLNGASAQTIGGGATDLSLFNLTVTNPAGITLARNVIVTGTLTGPVTLTSTCPINYTLTSNGGATVQNSCSGPDHYELSLPTSGITCLAGTATVTACTDATSPCTNPFTAASGTTATLATSAGTLGSTTVTFNASGVATTTLSYPAAADGATATVTLSGEQTVAVNPRQCCPNGVGCAVGNSCSATFNTAGFIFSDAADGAVATIPTQVAGTTSSTYYLRAVKTSTTTKACESALTGANTVNFGYECNDPTTCYTSDLMSVNGSVAGDGGWGTATTIARNDNGSALTYTLVNMTFDANGNAPFTFNYSDVGLVKLHTAKAAGGSLLSALAGSSNAFVVKPFGFLLSNIQATTLAGRCTVNPDSIPACALDATGARFVKAGEDFSVTVTAVTAASTAAPNYGQETAQEGVTLARALVAPAAGANPALGNPSAFGAFTNGVATGTTFNWSEVGIITLTPSVADGDYLGAGDTTGTTSANVGRFYPDHFNTSVEATATTPMPCPAGLTCPALYNGFIYSGQPFSVRVLAKNLADSTTTNYDDALGFSKAVTLAAWDALGSTTTQNPGPGALANVSVAATAFSAGVATTATPAYTFATSLTAPTDIYMRAVDTDTASSLRAIPANSVEGGVKVVSGKARISNAHGSELLPLPMTATVQYYNGTNWLSSTTDSVTSLTPALSNYQCKTGCAWTTTPAPLSGQVTSGVLPFKLSKPSSVGGTGSVDVSISAPNYLLTDSNGAVVNPSNTARATFGVYKGADEFIYLRENY